MSKEFMSKSLMFFLLAFGFCVQSAMSQASLGRELKIVSFSVADGTDYDTRETQTNFSGKLTNKALVKVFMPGKIETAVPTPIKKEWKMSGKEGKANYLWVDSHSNKLRIIPEGNTFKALEIVFSSYGIPKYTMKNKNGGLQAGKVYRLCTSRSSPYPNRHPIAWCLRRY